MEIVIDENYKLEEWYANTERPKNLTSIDINQETEEMTMEEVCKALGKTIKIKK